MPPCAGGALIWRGVCPWDKSAITRRRRTSSQSNRRFFGRRLAARAALSASSARYCPSGPVWRGISRHTTEGLRPIKWAIRTWDKPAFTPAMIAARSQAPSIRRHPMTNLQTTSPLHENCLHPMTLPCYSYVRSLRSMAQLSIEEIGWASKSRSINVSISPSLFGSPIASSIVRRLVWRSQIKKPRSTIFNRCEF